MSRIAKLIGREILDSRGRPTVEATCVLEGGVSGTCSVPSGASTGGAEAIELRDGDRSRYHGLGCRQAANNVSTLIHAATIGKPYSTQQDFDARLLELDGTPQKNQLGANAILAASLAFARAMASARGVPLYRYFAEIIGVPAQSLPQLTVNLFSGGLHAGGQVPIQDVLLVPVGASTIDESLSMVVGVYQAAVQGMMRRYAMRCLRADEGGLAPPFPNVEAMLNETVDAIREAGYETANQIAIAIDVASSHFYREGKYRLGDESLTAEQMIDRMERWHRAYPIVSIEDGLAEEDWDSWPLLRQRIGDRLQLLGDDLLCTNPTRIEKAVRLQAANALLLKVNQIGTLSEAARSLQLARSAGWRVTVSARSGETEDNWLADLAVGWNADQIKVGSVTQSERLAKYNRLLAIEAESHFPIRTRSS